MLVSEADVILIRNDPRSSYAVAKKFGITAATVCNIRTGRTRTGKKKQTIPAEQRFWKYVRKLDTNEVYPGAGLSGCWIWTGAKLEGNYGALRVDSQCRAAHRFSFELHKGPILEGQVVRHACDNSLCVNPEHLSSGTPQDNSDDASSRRRFPRGEENAASKLTEDRVKQIRKDSRPFRQIAEEHEITEGLVGHIKHKRVWAWVEGEVVFRNKAFRLTDSEVRAIRTDARPVKVIAREFDISRSAAWAIRQGSTYRKIS